MFAQIHMLTFYGPSNLNRDDLGRPKTCFMGGTERLRVSSQSIKRAVRTSTSFEKALDGHLGERTKRLGDDIETRLIGLGGDKGRSREIAREVGSLFGKIDGETTRLRQLAFIGPEEKAAAFAAAEAMMKGEEAKLDTVLRSTCTGVDIAMFGRMLADEPEYNREAAVQVSHATTTHRAIVEDDYFTAVDDLQKASDDEGEGAGHVGEAGFGSGLFYTYVCADLALLVRNLGGDRELARAGLNAMLEALTTVSPSGKQASFASRARASYALAEIGGQQPRSLIGAFQRAVRGDDLLAESIRRLSKTMDGMDKVYGACADRRTSFDVSDGTGSLHEVQSVVAEAVSDVQSDIAEAA